MAHWYKFWVLWFVLLQQNGGHELLNEEDDPGPGHLEPLGKQGPSLGAIDVIDSFPDPEDFYKKFVLASKPVLIKNGAKEIPAFTLWNDAYLSEKYGMEYVDVEMGKKEDRNKEAKRVRLNTFLKIYNDTDIYLVEDAMDSMKGELSLPRSLQCGGFQYQMLQAVLWFSSGGTKSVLHNDQPDNLNCILDGNKEIVFIDKKYQDAVQANGWQQDMGYSKLDVESVDLKAFPHFKSIPWWSATMLKGDCLFIPFKWYHAVKSSPTRNLAANLWFMHLMWFNETDCEENPPKQNHISLKDVTLEGLESIENLRNDLFGHLEGRKEVHREDVTEAWQETMSLEVMQQVFGLADANHDLVLSWEEIYDLDMLLVAQTFPHLLGLHGIEEVDGFEEGDVEQEEEDTHDEL